MGPKLIAVILIILIIFLPRCSQTYAESFDFEIFDEKELAFAKDITSLIVESTLTTPCDGSVFVVSSYCSMYIDYALAYLHDWAPPLIIISLDDSVPLTKSITDSWRHYLAWYRKSCSLIFVCDLDPPIDEDEILQVYNETTELEDSQIVRIKKKPADPGILHLPKFLTAIDQVLYLTERQQLPFTFFSASSSSSEGDNEDDTAIMTLEHYDKGVCINERSSKRQVDILQKTGILLSLRVDMDDFKDNENKSESVMNVCSECEFCSDEERYHYNHLGIWQRNKTHFSKYMNAFDNYEKDSFNNVHLRVGYFDYFPHFTCQKLRQNFTLMNPGKCLGTEWELLKELSNSLKFKFNLTNVGNPVVETKGEDETPVVEMTNFTKMIMSLRDDTIDMAVGGISITSERLAMVDFTQIFETEPIVFVVQKPKNIFVLGIWLAFQPQVWPIILLLIAIMSFLFQSIINNDVSPYPTCCFRTATTATTKRSLSVFIEETMKKAKRKPLLVRIFESLELTLQPMLGQPLNFSQILQPRRIKILLVLWWFSCLIITTFYNTSLISSLVNPVITREPTTLQDLIDAEYHFKFGGRHAAVRELINSSTLMDEEEDPSLKDTDDKMTLLLREIRTRLVPSNEPVNPNQVAYIIEESGIESEENNLQLSTMKIMKEKLFITGYAFALKPQAHYKRKIDISLGFLNAGGMIEHWTSHFIKDGRRRRGFGITPEIKFRLRQRLGQITLNLKILQGAFIFLIVGLTFSTLIFTLEHWNRRYRFRLYSKQQLIDMGRMLARYTLRFYQDHVVNDSNAVKRRRKQRREKFREVVDSVMIKIKSEGASNLTFLN